MLYNPLADPFVFGNAVQTDRPTTLSLIIQISIAFIKEKANILVKGQLR